MSNQDDQTDVWIPWDEVYKLGIPIIDEQHKHLVSLINKFYSELMSHNVNEGSGWQNALVTALRETVQYTKTHFSAEEKLMEAFGYSNYKYHKRCHQEFVETISHILTSFKSATPQTAFELASYLKEWILTHIAHEDRQYQKGLIEYSKKMNSSV